MSTSRPAELFTPDRKLLNPRFETYRLQSLDPSAARGHRLPGEGATQSRVGYGKQQLGFKEVRSRISWDHLDTRGNRGVYVDVEWNVVGFELDNDLAPTFTTLASLPQPVSSSDEHAEYPRALPLSDTLWAVSSGTGSIYLLSVSSPGSPFSGKFIARYDLDSPCLLYAAHADGSTYRLLLARAVVQESSGSKYAPRTATFDLLEVAISAEHTNDIDAGEPLKPEWELTGGDLPLWAIWAEDGWVVLSEEAFGPRPEPRTETEQERLAREHKERKAKLGLGAQLPSGDQTPAETPAETPARSPPPEFAPASISETQMEDTSKGDTQEAEDAQKEKMEETEKDEVRSLGRRSRAGSEVPESDADMDVNEARQYPFHWTQDASSVTITVPLPPSTPRSAINVDLTPTTASISVRAPNLSVAQFTFFSAGAHTFWSETPFQTWTYETTTGKLQIELEKSEGDGRWPSVFIPDSDGEDDVPETFSKDTLAAIRESFAVKTRSDDEMPGTNPTIPALLREQMDLDDGDDFSERTEGAFADLSAGSVGRSVLFGSVRQGKATWSRQPQSVLSLPLLTSDDLGRDQGVIVRHAVDGLLIAPAANGWKHIGTNPALAFVMSSKRDLRLVRHATKQHDGRAESLVLAFDAGSGTGQGNVYLYWPPRGNEDTARQGVLGISGGERGALLGVGEVEVGEGKRVAVALCEKSLVVLDLEL